MAVEETTFFKTHYSEKEIAECYAWYEKNMDHLPKKVNLPHGIKVRDVRKAATNIIKHLQKQMRTNSIFNGEFAILLMMREQVRQLEGFQEQP